MVMNVDVLDPIQEDIKEDLQSMQESLEGLKSSLENDATLASKQEFVSLMKDIVLDMSKVDNNQGILDLYKELESSNTISSALLEGILSSFVSLKLAYVDASANHSLEKYEQITHKKTELDTLLSRVQTVDSYQIDPNAPAAVTNQPPLDVDDTSGSDVEEDGWLMKNTKAIFSKEEWEKDWKMNAVRSVSGLAIVGGAVRGVKKLWSWMSGDKKESSNKSDEKEGMSRWKKGLIALGITGVGVGVWKYWDKIKESLGFGEKLSFEDAMSKVNGDVRNMSEKNIQTGFDGIVYDESGGLLKSYNQEIKMDKSAKKIDGLDMKFSDYEQLIFTANFVNAVKRNYAGKCGNNTPFSIDWGGDLVVNTDDTGKEKNVEVMSGGFFSTLAKYAPDIDGGLWSKLFGGGKQGRAKLQAYLNRLDIWKSGPAQLQEDPALPSTHDVQSDIVNTRPDLEHGGVRKSIETYKIPGTDNKYEIGSYDTSVLAEYHEGVGYRIQGLDISFKDDAEVIRVATFINKMKFEYSSMGITASPFSYEIEYLDKGIWISTKKEREEKGFKAWLKGVLTNKINVLERSSIKDKMPTVWQDRNIDLLITYLNTIKKQDNTSWWK